MTEIALPPLLRSPRIRVALIVTTAGLCLGLLAPFGSYLNAGLGSRLFYWCGSVWLGFLLLLGAWHVWLRFAANRRQRRWLTLVALLLGVMAVQSVATHLAAFAIWPDLRSHGPGWGVWCLQNGLTEGCGFAALQVMRRRSTHDVPAVDETPALPERPVRVSQLGQDVIALQMEDHYVRIHTSAGSQLVHMTLTEAIEALGPANGLKTHRSWWVARHAVERIEGTPRSMRLQLRGGLAAPVARGAVTLLRDAGWIDAMTAE
ncbi:response regulator receiver protein [Gluconacetobacter sacchari DSM 12717]|uniref:LytTR family transcriptional regulator n=2 Tax=Gluconacetobacter sacchari TaxID=92759 RepID=A0A7W4ID92_9PROT|nr:LytTR family DNA-binding domain-containing protein [Gluconacetobacter sacchari]MBB2160734.1 LytTR family transcriptional regulator [Gluconacetobacter sacchari]GBQ29127.1 response regulator receiver protein [Gluconacetobacter sacchari DSM 12717]